MCRTHRVDRCVHEAQQREKDGEVPEHDADEGEYLEKTVRSTLVRGYKFVEKDSEEKTRGWPARLTANAMAHITVAGQAILSPSPTRPHASCVLHLPFWAAHSSTLPLILFPSLVFETTTSCHVECPDDPSETRNHYACSDSPGSTRIQLTRSPGFTALHRHASAFAVWHRRSNHS